MAQNENTGTFKVSTPSDREITMTRVFDAPRSLVFHALTKPELVKRWLLGPPGWSMPVCEIDLKIGGAWRYVWRNADGREFGMSGTYREIAAPDRIVHLERFEDAARYRNQEQLDSGRRSLVGVNRYTIPAEEERPVTVHRIRYERNPCSRAPA